MVLPFSPLFSPSQQTMILNQRLGICFVCFYLFFRKSTSQISSPPSLLSPCFPFIFQTCRLSFPKYLRKQQYLSTKSKSVCVCVYVGTGISPNKTVTFYNLREKKVPLSQALFHDLGQCLILLKKLGNLTS